MPLSDFPSIQGLSDDELAQLRRSIMQEQNLRRRLDASPEKIEAAIAEYQQASGIKDGDEWVPRHPLYRDRWQAQSASTEGTPGSRPSTITCGSQAKVDGS
ncbi:hypothetical protein [Nesterenkonia pannonica]|uniref:hypothetical protein n=1 Tax=Nesterenkonia pannonica TaxID=1548602 RepID=UPI002164A39B|nr:hypothetical protein [Nesterenkonia pannonica]